MTSLEIREFKQTISNFVRDTELPDEVKRMVLSEILREQGEQTVQTLKREIEERDAMQKGVEKNAESAQQDILGELSE